MFEFLGQGIITIQEFVQTNILIITVLVQENPS